MIIRTTTGDDDGKARNWHDRPCHPVSSGKPASCGRIAGNRFIGKACILRVSDRFCHVAGVLLERFAPVTGRTSFENAFRVVMRSALLVRRICTHDAFRDDVVVTSVLVAVVLPGKAIGHPGYLFLRIPRRKRRCLEQSYYSLGKSDYFLTFTDFYRIFGLSWETSTLKH